MTNLQNALITSMLPYDIANKPEVKALSASFSKQLKKLMHYSDCCDFFFNLDLVDEEMLDYFAIDFNVVEYDVSLTKEQKKTLIQNAFLNWEKAGTKSSVLDIIRTIDPKFNVAEWFEFGGDPGTFRIEIENAEAPVYQDFQKLIEFVDAKKRASAHINKISFDLVTAEMTEKQAMVIQNTDFINIFYNNQNKNYNYPFLILKNAQGKYVVSYVYGEIEPTVSNNNLLITTDESIDLFVENGHVYLRSE